MTFAAAWTALLLAAGPLSSTHVVAVSDASGAASTQALAGLQRAGATVEMLAVEDPALGARLAVELPPGAVWLALGPRSARRVAGAAGSRKACALVRAEELPDGLGGVALEPSPAEALAWMASAFPGHGRVLLLRGAPAGAETEALTAVAKAQGLKLEVLAAREPGEAVPAVEAALESEHADALLWLRPDKAAVTVDTVGPLIEAALAYRVPAVGASGYFLKAGALAAESADPGESAVTAVQLARAGSREHRTPPGKLVVDGRRAERLGILVKAGPHVEVSR